MNAIQTLTPAIVTPAIQWDSPVFTANMRGPSGQIIPEVFGVFSEGSEIFLGSYRKETSLVQNLDLICMFEQALDELGLKFSRTIICNGSEMRAFYRIDSIQFNGPDGKPIALRVQLTNSYNGRLKVQAIIEALRLICLNGVIGFGQVFNMAQRHSSKLDVASIVATLAPQLENAPSAFAGLHRLAETALSVEQGEFFLRNLALANSLKFSGLMARRFEEAYRNPAEDEKDTHQTLWGLYNAGTRTLRDMETEKVELVQKVGEYYSLALDKAAREPETFKRLIQPVTAEKAYSRNN
jgi:hypothetical protein